MMFNGIGVLYFFDKISIQWNSPSQYPQAGEWINKLACSVLNAASLAQSAIGAEKREDVRELKKNTVVPLQGGAT